jgi:hypothetical protein
MKVKVTPQENQKCTDTGTAFAFFAGRWRKKKKSGFI